jgi:DNA-binding CsgD family transcriptional regulator
MSEPSNSRQMPKTKKARITELLVSNEHSDKEIARMAGTSIGNVWKEKSNLKAQGYLLTRKVVERSERSDETILLATQSEDNLVSGLPQAISRTRNGVRAGFKNGHYQFLSLPGFNEDSMKTLYREFKAGKAPADILAEYGFHPEIVEKEYLRFLKFMSLDVHSLQEKILSRVKQLPAARVYVDKFQSGKILTNDELLEVIELYAKEETRAQTEFNSIVLESDPPGRWKALNCNICNKPLLGVLVYPDYKNGRLIKDYCKGWTHYECRT